MWKEYKKEILLLCMLSIILIVFLLFHFFMNCFNKKNVRVICSLSTIPERVERGTINKTIKSLNEQTMKPDIIYVNIARELNNKKYDIDKLNNLKKEHQNLIINIVEKDIGPITKIIPVIKLLKSSDKLILLDDDVSYDKRTIETLLNSNMKAVGFHGFRRNENKEFGYISDVKETEEVDILETFHGVLYNADILSGLEEYNNSLNGVCFKQDDIKISKYLKTKGIKLYCIPKTDNMNTTHDAQDTPELRNENLVDGNKNCFKQLF